MKLQPSLQPTPANLTVDNIHEFSLYAPALLKIKTKTAKIIPFTFNQIQTKLNFLWEEQLRTTGMIRLNVLKARQEGVSTYVEGRMFHNVCTIANTNGYIVTHDKPSLNTIFSMSKLFYDYLPDEFRPMTRYSSKEELVFENPNQKSRLVEPGLRSQLGVFLASNANATRSGGYQHAHFSEVAFYPNPEQLVTSTVPAIPTLPGTSIVRESTANGRGNWFHQEWLRASKGESNFLNVFFSWLENPNEYSLPFNADHEKRELLNTLTEEERELHHKHKATWEQLNWRRFILRDLGGDIEKFHQEYPTTAEEAFISSGTKYFNMTKLKLLLDSCVPPIFRGKVDSRKITEDSNGELKIWEHPKPGEHYVVSCDVAEGVEGGNFSSMEVLKVPTSYPRIEQVAEFHMIVDPVTLGHMLVTVARYYNNALVSPEINNHGLTTLNTIKATYWNIYQWQYFDKFASQQTKRLGWMTTPSTKPLICNFTSFCVNDDVLILRSAELVEEMIDFIRNPYGGESESGFDDLVMALMIGVFTMNAHHDEVQGIIGVSVDPDEILERNQEESEDKGLGGNKQVDPTILAYLSHIEQGRGTADYGWMDY